MTSETPLKPSIGEVNFDVGYSFIASPRPRTPAADMVDDVPEEEKAASVYSAGAHQPAGQCASRRMLGFSFSAFCILGRRHLPQEHYGTLRSYKTTAVNFEGTPDDVISKFIGRQDCRSADQLAAREKRVRTEDEMGLRIARSRRNP